MGILKHAVYATALFCGLAISGGHHRISLTDEPQPYREVKSAPEYQLGKDSAVFVRMTGGTCSGTLYKNNHTIVTAMHCVHLGGPIVQVNDIPVDAQVIASDGHDHILVHLDRDIAGRPTEFAPMPPAGAEVYIWGNPLDFRSLLRVGHVAGKYRLDGDLYDVFDMNTWHGDSGAAFFDAKGRIVAINEGVRYDTAESGWSMVIAQPMTFTPGQLKGV
jgi:S1-C subfamily serine protease